MQTSLVHPKGDMEIRGQAQRRAITARSGAAGKLNFKKSTLEPLDDVVGRGWLKAEEGR